jgi:hypothetical protein
MKYEFRLCCSLAESRRALVVGAAASDAGAAT